MENVVDVDAFTANVVVPEDLVDPVDQASWLASIQPLANRTRNLKNRLDTLIASRIVNRIFSMVSKGYALAADWNITNVGNWLSASDFGSMQVDISNELVQGATLTSVTVKVVPGVARPTSNHRMRANLRIREWATSGTTTDLRVTGVPDDGTTAIQDIVVTPDAPHIVDKTAYVYTVMVSAGIDGGTNFDSILGVGRSSCTAPALNVLAYP